MTAPADPLTAPFTITESTDRIEALDPSGALICGAFKPAGHVHWHVFVTPRLSIHLHHVIATTPQIARWHVEMIAGLFVGGAA